MKKRFLAVFLTLALCLGLMPATVFAADSDFVIEDGVLIKYNGPGGDVIIPDGVKEIGGYNLHHDNGYIEWVGAFSDCTSLTSVTIPDSVTEIGWYAFSGCSNLTNVSIGSGVTYIDSDAFTDTPWLESQGKFSIVNGILWKYQGNDGNITIPNSVTKIGWATFSGCENLTDVTIPNSVTEIGGFAFSDCTSLTNVIIPNSVTEIGEWAFRDCSNLTSVAILNGVIEIEDYAFGNCVNLTKVTIPSSIKVIGANAFDLLEEFGNDGETVEFFTPGFLLENIYYGGTKEQWNAIRIDEENETLKTATIHFNSVAPSTPAFTDVPDWCAAPVSWAVDKEITNGTGDNKFSPQDLCKHAEILTFLWRAAGKPNSDAALPMDIAGKNVDWATAALRWATEKGMIDGTLDPAARCTRSDAVTYIWKALGGTEVGGTASFSDVPASAAYAKAVAWAVANGVTNGYEDGTFGPGKTCSRGEIITLLHRAYVEEARLK